MKYIFSRRSTARRFRTALLYRRHLLLQRRPTSTRFGSVFIIRPEKASFSSQFSPILKHKFGIFSVVQAQYWHDPNNEKDYQKKSIFLADVNNEVVSFHSFLKIYTVFQVNSASFSQRKISGFT